MRTEPLDRYRASVAHALLEGAQAAEAGLEGVMADMDALNVLGQFGHDEGDGAV